MDQPNQQTVAAASTANIERAAQVELNKDCWEKVFDYLSIKDINSMSQTCKRLKGIAGDYIQDYLPAICGEVEFGNDEHVHVWYDYVNVNGLTEFINGLKIDCSKRDVNLKFNDWLCVKSFPSVKSLELRIDTTEHQFSFIEKILKNIETLEISRLNLRRITGNHLTALLQQCPKLKCLRLQIDFDSHTGWIHNKYPTLEHFGISRYCHLSGSEIVTFLMNNPNIKRLEIPAETMLHHKRAFEEADIQLNCLVIDFSGIMWVSYDEFIEFLVELQGRRFYQSLHIRISYGQNNQEFFNGIAKLNLNTVNVLDIDTSLNVDICSIVCLKEIRLSCFPSVDVIAVAKSLLNLEKLYIKFADMRQLLPFVRYSEKLSMLHIEEWDDSSPLNLTKLNNERQQLKGELQGRRPKVVCIRLTEKYYLATQWRMKNIHFDFIKLERAICSMD